MGTHFQQTAQGIPRFFSTIALLLPILRPGWELGPHIGLRPSSERQSRSPGHHHCSTPTDSREMGQRCPGNYAGNGGLLIQTCCKVLYIHISPNPLDERGETPEQTDFVILKSFIETWRILDPRDRETAMAVGMLFETLMACWFEALRVGTEWVDWKTLVYRRMRRDGWCPAELSMMSGRLNTMSIFFMSRVRRPNLTKKHSMMRIHSTLLQFPRQSLRKEGGTP
jgi:hypothetical protein